jgi:hypothetical protein
MTKQEFLDFYKQNICGDPKREQSLLEFLGASSELAAQMITYLDEIEKDPTRN